MQGQILRLCIAEPARESDVRNTADTDMSCVSICVSFQTLRSVRPRQSRLMKSAATDQIDITAVCEPGNPDGVLDCASLAAFALEELKLLCGFRRVARRLVKGGPARSAVDPDAAEARGSCEPAAAGSDQDRPARTNGVSSEQLYSRVHCLELQLVRDRRAYFILTNSENRTWFGESEVCELPRRAAAADAAHAHE